MANSLIGFGVAYGIVFVVVGMGWLLQQRNNRVPAIRSSRAERQVQLLLIFLLVGCGALVTYISFTDFDEAAAVTALNASAIVPPAHIDREENRPPIGLALADACIVMFGVLMLPTPRYATVAMLLRTSYERLVWLHTVAALLMIALMVAHAAAMDALDGTGLVVLVASLVATLPALFRRYAYKLFRITHCAVLVAIVFAIIHSGGRVLIMLAPGLALWIVDGVKKWRVMRHAVAIRLLTCNKVNDLIVFVVDWTGTEPLPAPAQFALIVLPDIDYIPHPFSVAVADIIAEPSVPTEVRSIDVGAASSRQNHRTEQSGGTVTTKRLTFIIRASSAKSSWTRKLASIAAEGATLQHAIRIVGIHGEGKIPLAQIRHVVLIAGGTGVSPMISILNFWMRRRQREAQTEVQRTDNAATSAVRAPPLQPQSLHLIWVGRSLEDVYQLGPCIQGVLQGGDCGATATTTAAVDAASRDVSLVYYRTKAPALVLPDVGGDMSGIAVPRERHRMVHGFRICDGRPQWGQELPRVASEIVTSDVNAFKSDRVGLYCCGPASLTDACTEVAETIGFLVQTEVFEI